METTFQFENAKGPFWKQHKVERDLYAADGHRYMYGAFTHGKTVTFGYGLHSIGCTCVLRAIAEEKNATV